MSGHLDGSDLSTPVAKWTVREPRMPYCSDDEACERDAFREEAMGARSVDWW